MVSLKDALTVGLLAIFSATMLVDHSDRPVATEEEIPAPLLDQPASQEEQLHDKLAQAQEAPHQGQPNVTLTVQRHQQLPSIKITSEFVDQCMEVAEQVNPDWATRIRGLCENRPEEFERFILQSGRRLVALVELRQRDPDLYRTKLDELRIEVQIGNTVNALRQMHADGRFDTPEAESLKTELRGLVQNQTAYSLKARGDYILRLRKHVDALQKQLEQDALNFFNSVEKRYQTLLEMP